MERWRLSGREAGEQRGGRFRLEVADHKVVGNWSWYENPFIGSRPFAALVTFNVLLNNWHLKTSNNMVYEVRHEDGVRQRRFVVRDLGASLGNAHQRRPLA